MSLDNDDSLQFVPMEEWDSLERAFLADWPRGIPGYSALVTQRKLVELGLDYGFKVYRPRGDISNGMVALNKKETLYEVIIQCPKDDTSQLEEALLSTKLIDWSKAILVPYLPVHTMACVKRVADKIGLDHEDDNDHPPHYIVFFSKNRPPFENLSLPEDMKFGNLSKEHIEWVDSFWPNRYDSSQWFFRLLINSNTAYGLFKNNELVTWVFVNEIGALAHLFTLEAHRKKGYAKLLMQLVCNLRISEKKDVFACCLNINNSALKLYESLGFEQFHTVQWLYLLSKEKTGPKAK